MRGLQTFQIEKQEENVFEKLERFDISETFKGDDGNEFVEKFLREC